VIDIVRETGALDGSRQAAMAEAQRAINALQLLPNGTYKDALISLASQLLGRRT
jgi:octaprenyl-diphosphate synthase